MEDLLFLLSRRLADCGGIVRAVEVVSTDSRLFDLIPCAPARVFVDLHRGMRLASSSHQLETKFV